MGVTTTAFMVVALAVGWSLLQNWLKPRPPKDVHGFCSPKFAAVKEIFRANLESGEEEGGAFAAYHEGELVCELWGGWADDAIQYPWKRNTLATLYSAIKAVSAICVIVLADRGLIDLSQPVARYWPEFAQNGKENITVRMLIAHQAGLSALDKNITYLDVQNNPDRLSAILAEQKPHWKPGTMSGYHTLTIGFYMDELVKRVDPQHRTMQQFFIQEISRPLDLDIHMGLPLAENYRLARPIGDPLTSPTWKSLFEVLSSADAMQFFHRLLLGNDPLLKRTLTNPQDGEKLSPFFHEWPEYRAISDGSAHGYGTAQSLAKLYGILANGGTHKDKQLLSSSSVNLLRQPVWSGQDRILGINGTWGHGLVVQDVKPGVRMFGFPGHGGQLGFGCIEKKLGWAYVTNHMSLMFKDNLPRYLKLRNALLDVKL